MHRVMYSRRWITLVLGKPLKRRRQVRFSLGEQINVKSNFGAHWGSLLSAGGKLTVTVAPRPSVDNVPASPVFSNAAKCR